jgi:hypothetical protein
MYTQKITDSTASALGGGKFANGALAGAFVHLFNAEARKFIRVTKAMMRKGRALSIMQHANRYRSMHCRGCVPMTLQGAYERTYAIDRFDNRLGMAALSIAGGVALAPVAEAGYLWAMRNPWIAEFGADAISSALPATTPASSTGGAVGFFGNLIYEYIRGNK